MPFQPDWRVTGLKPGVDWRAHEADAGGAGVVVFPAILTFVLTVVDPHILISAPVSSIHLGTVTVKCYKLGIVTVKPYGIGDLTVNKEAA